MHKNTPTVSVLDPRRLDIASVSYCREVPGATAVSRIHRQTYNAAGQATVSCDPRLHALIGADPDARPNLTKVYSLTGAILHSDSVDSGRRWTLPGVAGQSVSSWDGQGTQIQTEYDLLMRPTRIIEIADGTSARNRAFYTYGHSDPSLALHNQCGQLIRLDDDAGTLHFPSFALTGADTAQTRHFLEQLDDPNWPADEADRDLLHETGDGATTRTCYNALGERISLEDADGNVQFSDLDVAGQLVRIRLKLAAQTDESVLLRDIAYSAGGQIQRQISGNGVISESRYDLQSGHLMEIVAGLADQLPLQHLKYSYDGIGNILGINDMAQPTHFFRNQKIEPTSTYTYNSLYQLIAATGWQRINTQNGPQEPEFGSPADPGQLENYRQSYSYDPGGNLTTVVHVAASHSWTQRMAISRYSNRGLAQKPDGSLPSESEIVAGFDPNGNKRLLQPGQDLTWTASNRLRQVDQVVREDGPTDSERYIYDVGGQRKRKVRLVHKGASIQPRETRYLPDLTRRESPGESMSIKLVQAGRCAVEVLHWTRGGPGADLIHYSLSNHLGSSLLMLDQHANIISHEHYYPHGITCWWAGPDKVQASYKTRRYAGQERDVTGLYYCEQRYYAPWWMCWISADPAGVVDGLNLYAMVRGNPVRFVDLQGLAGFDTVAAVGATVARDLPSALIAVAVQYAVAGFLSPMSVAVTAVGATAGAITGGISGYASANWARSALHMDDPDSWGPLLAQVSGAAMGAALGAAPSLLGMLDPIGNTAAVTQIGSAFGTVFRELTFQHFASAGPSNPSVGRADFVTGAASMGAVGAIGGAVGYGGSVLFGAQPAGIALQSIFSASTATGLGAGGASAVRGLMGTPTKPSKGTPATFDPNQAVVGCASRHFFSSLGQLAHLAAAQIPGYSTLDANTQAAVSRAISNTIFDLRSTFVTTATPGLSGVLGQNNYDVEKGKADVGITQENVPISSNAAYDPAATEIFYITGETTRGQRKYSRSNLRYQMTHM